MIKGYLSDAAALCGSAAVLVGLWWIYPPAALIVGGLVVTAAGVWGALLCRS